MSGLVEGRAAYWQQRWSTTKEVKHLFCVHGKWRKAAGIPDSSTHVRVLEKKERVAGTWNQTAGASLLGFGQSWPWALLPFLSHLPFWGGTKGLRQRGKGRNWGRCAQGIRGHHLHCCLQKRQHLTAKRHNHYLMPVPYQHFLLRWSKKNYRVTPKCSNALLRTWTSQFWCWSEIHTVN